MFSLIFLAIYFAQNSLSDIYKFPKLLVHILPQNSQTHYIYLWKAINNIIWAYMYIPMICTYKQCPISKPSCVHGSFLQVGQPLEPPKHQQTLLDNTIRISCFITNYVYLWFVLNFFLIFFWISSWRLWWMVNWEVANIVRVH